MDLYSYLMMSLTTVSVLYFYLKGVTRKCLSRFLIRPIKACNSKLTNLHVCLAYSRLYVYLTVNNIVRLPVVCLERPVVGQFLYYIGFMRGIVQVIRRVQLCRFATLEKLAFKRVIIVFGSMTRRHVCARAFACDAVNTGEVLEWQWAILTWPAVDASLHGRRV